MKADVLALVQELSLGQADSILAEAYYYEIINELGEREILTTATLLEVIISEEGEAGTTPQGFVVGLPNVIVGAGSGTGGTVTSVALALPAQEFTVSGSPVTTIGTLTGLRKAAFSGGSINGAVTLDFNNGDKQIFTATGNVTFTFSNPVNGAIYILILKQDGTGGRTWTFPVEVKGSLSLSLGANEVDLLVLLYDGTNYWPLPSYNL